MTLAAVYAAVSLVIALVAASREYGDDRSVVSAAAVGLVAGVFWPVILVLLLIGGAAMLWGRFP